MTDSEQITSTPNHHGPAVAITQWAEGISVGEVASSIVDEQELPATPPPMNQYQYDLTLSQAQSTPSRTPVISRFGAPSSIPTSPMSAPHSMQLEPEPPLPGDETLPSRTFLEKHHEWWAAHLERDRIQALQDYHFFNQPVEITTQQACPEFARWYAEQLASGTQPVSPLCESPARLTTNVSRTKCRSPPISPHRARKIASRLAQEMALLRSMQLRLARKYRRMLRLAEGNGVIAPDDE